MHKRIKTDYNHTTKRKKNSEKQKVKKNALAYSHNGRKSR